MSTSKSYKDEVESGFHLSEGEEVTVEGLDLVYREEESGYFYDLESTDRELKVLTSQRLVSRTLHLAAGNWRSIGLDNYHKMLDESDLISPGEGEYTPKPEFKSQEVKEELRDLVDRFLEE
jgi:hypothetical protein